MNTSGALVQERRHGQLDLCAQRHLCDFPRPNIKHVVWPILAAVVVRRLLATPRRVIARNPNGIPKIFAGEAQERDYARRVVLRQKLQENVLETLRFGPAWTSS